MRRFGLPCKALSLAVLALAWCQAPARAGLDVTVFSSVTPLAGNLYQYTYMVVDNPGSTIAVSEFDVAVNDPIGITAITAPGSTTLNFFNSYTPGDAFISFVDVSDGGIMPGQSATFSFVSTSFPGMVGDSVGGFDASGNPVQTPGLVLGASIVPEPSSLLLCALGAVGVVGVISRRRRVA